MIPLKILLAEKDGIVREIVKDWLEDEEHSVDIYLPNIYEKLNVKLCGNNNDVLARLAPAYEALILDRETFGIDGIQFVGAVNQIIATQYAGRIIATTTLNVLTNPERERFSEKVHWIDKPYKMCQLQAGLKRK